MDKISVIVPIYKVEKYLRQCLDSIVNQTYRNLEIILVDDGSPDNCGKICDEYARSDERIIVIHKENGGLSAARNDGIQRATGDWIAFVDSDDWCEPDYYEKLIAEAEGTDVDVVFAGGHILETNSGSRKVVRFTSTLLCQGENEIKTLLVKSISDDYGYPWDKLYRAEFLRANHLSFDIKCHAAEDAWFNFQVLHRARKVICCTVRGYHYRFVHTSITRGYSPEKPAAVYELLTKLHIYADENQLSKDVRQAIDGAAIGYIAMTLNCYYFHPANPKERFLINKELNEMVSQPLFHEAIYSRSNRYLSKRQQILKYALRLNRGGGTSRASRGQAEAGAVTHRFQGELSFSRVCR